MPKGEVQVAKGVATREAVLAYLIHEADLEGLVTTSQNQVGAAVGVEGTVAGLHLRALMASGVITRVGCVERAWDADAGAYVNSYTEYQLPEALL